MRKIAHQADALWLILPMGVEFGERDPMNAITPFPKRVLFLGVENSNRSQMAEAFARLHGADEVEPYSAGTRPSGHIRPKAIEAMREVGYDLSRHASKSLAEIPAVEYDVVIVMGRGDEGCSSVRGKRHEAWQIPDSEEMPPERFRAVRDLIEQKVRLLLSERARWPEDQDASARTPSAALHSALPATSDRPSRRRALIVAASVAALLGALVLGLLWTADLRSVGETAPVPTAAQPPGNGATVWRGDFLVWPKVRLLRAENKSVLADLGALREWAKPPQVGDGVSIQAPFTVPVYPYLLAIQPDGTCEELFPKDAPLQPVQDFLSPQTPGSSWPLKKAGLMSLVVVVGKQPLPPFAQWQPRIDPHTWKQMSARGPWVCDGWRLEPLIPERLGEAEIGPQPFVAACKTLLERADVAAVRGVAFPVR